MTSWPQDEDDLDTETLDDYSSTQQQHNQTADESLMNEDFLAEAIREHAKFLGMDPDVDQDYLYIAEEALTAPLPEGWQQAEAEDGTPYHFNPDTGESLWEHPLDEVYRQKFRDAKAQGLRKPANNTKQLEEEERAIQQQLEEEHNREQDRQDRRRQQQQQEEEEEERQQQQRQQQQQERKKQEEREQREAQERQTKAHQNTREEDTRQQLDAQAQSGSKDDWLNEIEELSTLGKDQVTTNITKVESLIGGDWDDDDDDDDDDIVLPIRQRTFSSSGTSSSSPGRSNTTTTTTTLATQDMNEKIQAAEQARNIALSEHAAATTKHQEVLSNKDAKISELNRRLLDQRTEYEEVLSEQKEIMKENEGAMNELTDLHAQEILELTEQINTTRKGINAVKETHVLDVERLQNEITTMREQSNGHTDEMTKYNQDIATKDTFIADQATALEEMEEKLDAQAKQLIDFTTKVGDLERVTSEAQSNVSNTNKTNHDLTLKLKKLENKNNVLNRAKSALSDEIRKLVSEKDTIQLSLNAMIGEQDNLKQRIAEHATNTAQLDAQHQADQTTLNDMNDRKMQEMKKMETTRLNELRKSFEERCAALINERSTASEKSEEMVGTLKRQLNDMRIKATAVVNDSENLKNESTNELKTLRDEKNKYQALYHKEEEVKIQLTMASKDMVQQMEKQQTRTIELERMVQEMTDRLKNGAQQQKLQEQTTLLKKKDIELVNATKELNEMTAMQPKMQETFRQALKEAMERAAAEATSDCEGAWQAKMEATRTEYVQREQQLISDQGSNRSRLRETTDRLIELERHAASALATLDVVRRENLSLQSSLDHARNELTTTHLRHQNTVAGGGAVHHYGMTHNMNNNRNSMYSQPPPAAPHATSFYSGQQPPMMMGMPPAPSVDDSQKILAIQNQVSFFFVVVVGRCGVLGVGCCGSSKRNVLQD